MLRDRELGNHCGQALEALQIFAPNAYEYAIYHLAGVADMEAQGAVAAWE